MQQGLTWLELNAVAPVSAPRLELPGPTTGLEVYGWFHAGVLKGFGSAAWDTGAQFVSLFYAETWRKMRDGIDQALNDPKYRFDAGRAMARALYDGIADFADDTAGDMAWKMGKFVGAILVAVRAAREHLGQRAEPLPVLDLVVRPA